MTCKYCDDEIKKGTKCEKCRNKQPLVKHLQKQFDQLRELKAKRDARRRLKK